MTRNATYSAVAESGVRRKENCVTHIKSAPGWAPVLHFSVLFFLCCDWMRSRGDLSSSCSLSLTSGPTASLSPFFPQRSQSLPQNLWRLISCKFRSLSLSLYYQSCTFACLAVSRSPQKRSDLVRVPKFLDILISFPTFLLNFSFKDVWSCFGERFCDSKFRDFEQ